MYLAGVKVVMPGHSTKGGIPESKPHYVQVYICVGRGIGVCTLLCGAVPGKIPLNLIMFISCMYL